MVTDRQPSVPGQRGMLTQNGAAFVGGTVLVFTVPDSWAERAFIDFGYCCVS